jgi:hypothetical protein
MVQIIRFLPFAVGQYDIPSTSDRLSDSIASVSKFVVGGASRELSVQEWSMANAKPNVLLTILEPINANPNGLSFGDLNANLVCDLIGWKQDDDVRFSYP